MLVGGVAGWRGMGEEGGRGEWDDCFLGVVPLMLMLLLLLLVMVVAGEEMKVVVSEERWGFGGSWWFGGGGRVSGCPRQWRRLMLGDVM